MIAILGGLADVAELRRGAGDDIAAHSIGRGFQKS
jgi:hypothetical protein